MERKELAEKKDGHLRSEKLKEEKILQRTTPTEEDENVIRKLEKKIKLEMERLYVEKMKSETEKELKIHKIQLKKGLIEMTKKWQSSERSTIKLPKLELTKFDGNILKCNIFQIPSKQQPITINHFKMFSNQTTYEHNYVIKQRTLSLA